MYENTYLLANFKDGKISDNPKTQEWYKDSIITPCKEKLLDNKIIKNLNGDAIKLSEIKIPYLENPEHKDEFYDLAKELSSLKSYLPVSKTEVFNWSSVLDLKNEDKLQYTWMDFIAEIAEYENIPTLKASLPNCDVWVWLNRVIALNEEITPTTELSIIPNQKCNFKTKNQLFCDKDMQYDNEKGRVWFTEKEILKNILGEQERDELINYQILIDVIESSQKLKFVSHYIDKINDKIETEFDTVFDLLCLIPNEETRRVLREQIWQFAHDIYGEEKVKSKIYVHSDMPLSLWKKCNEQIIEDLAKKISFTGENLPLKEVSFGWRKHFLDFCTKNNCWKYIKNYAIVPSQAENKLIALGNLYFDETEVTLFSNTLLDIAIDLDAKFKRKLMSKDFNEIFTIENFKAKDGNDRNYNDEKLQEEILKKISPDNIVSVIKLLRLVPSHNNEVINESLGVNNTDKPISKHLEFKNRCEIYDFAKEVYKEICINDTSQGIEKISENVNEQLWEKCDKLLLKDMANKFADKNIADLLTNYNWLNMEWLCRFADFLVKADMWDIVEDKAIIPCQNPANPLKKLADLHRHEEEAKAIALVDVLEILEPQLKDTLMDRAFNDIFPKGFKKEIYSGETIEKKILTLLNKPNNDELCLQAIKKLLVYKTPVSENSPPKSIYQEKLRDFAIDLYEWDNIQTTEVEWSFDWTEVNKWLLNSILEKIGRESENKDNEDAISQNSVDSLCIYIKKDTLCTLKWIENLLNFVKGFNNDLKTIKIYPNRNLKFCDYSNIFNGYADAEKKEAISSDLVEIYSKLVKNTPESLDWKEILLHEQIKFDLGKEENTKTNENLANTIKDFIAEKSSDDLEKNSKQGLSELLSYVDSISEKEKNLCEILLQSYQRANKINLSEEKIKQVQALEKAGYNEEQLFVINNNPDLIKNLLANRENQSSESTNKVHTSDTNTNSTQSNAPKVDNAIEAKINTRIVEDNGDDETKKRIGRWGEEFVNKLLKQQKQNGKIKDFEWMNEDEESNEPYDFEVIPLQGDEYYIDAKATSEDKTKPILLTKSEWEFLFEKREKYVIYRVYNIDLKKKVEVGNAAYYKCSLFKWLEGSVSFPSRDSRLSLKIHAN